MVNLNEIQAHETSRCTIYKGLSQCFQNPDQELIQVVQSMEHHCAELRSGALSAVRSLLDDLSADGTLEHMQVDFAGLFIGPYALSAPPYGSIYLENQHRIMGPSTMDVIRFYRDAGLEIAPTYKEAPDHIAAELEFMHFLIFKEIRLLEQQDFDRLAPLIVNQCDFLHHHLGAWIPAFAPILKTAAGTKFYRYLAEVTERFIAEDMKNLLDLKRVVEERPCETVNC